MPTSMMYQGYDLVSYNSQLTFIYALVTYILEVDKGIADASES